MKTSGKILIKALALGSLILVLSVAGTCSAESTFVRLSFWVPPERMAEFETAYKEKVVPILSVHGLVEVSDNLSQQPINLDFSSFTEGQIPQGWFASDNNSQDYDTGVDQSVAHTGKASGFIKSKVSEPEGSGTLKQTFEADHYRGKRLRLSGYVKANNIDNRAGLWMRVDGPDKPLSFDNMGDRPIRGTADWKKYEIVLEVPENSVRIAFGILLRGKGQAWIDGLQFDVVGAITGPAVPYSAFSRRLEFKTVSNDVADRFRGILRDSAWQEVLRDLGATYGTTRPDALIRYSLMLYTGPGSGRVVSAGPGKVAPAGRGTGHWRTYDVTDGLADGIVQSIFQDREGHLWFGTYGGVSRYDGQTFTTLTTKDGLTSNYVSSILEDRDGHLWFSTQSGASISGGGVSRYDGKTWTTFTTKDGLARNEVYSAFQDREGFVWFGTIGGGVSRYDGKTWTTFTTKDGLANNDVSSILQDLDGRLWFGTWGGGVSRYDGKTWTTFTTKDGLVSNVVAAMLQDRKGYLWFSCRNRGVSRYDGKTWTTFTTKDGLANNFVRSIFQDRDGHLWFGTGNGVSRFDGQAFTNFTTEDGLSGNDVLSIFQDREGSLWFGTVDGLSRYDGDTFLTFTTKDGLGGHGCRLGFT